MDNYVDNRLGQEKKGNFQTTPVERETIMSQLNRLEKILNELGGHVTSRLESLENQVQQLYGIIGR